VIIATACFSASVSAKDKEKGPNKTVPFDVMATTTEVVLPPGPNTGCGPLPVGRTTGTGTANMLGRFTLTATDCIMPAFPNARVVYTDPQTGMQFYSAYQFSNGMLTFEAANGDQLFATYSGVLNFLPNDQQLLIYTISQGSQLTFTGGTGRFAGASGSGYLGGMTNLATGKGQFNVTATLTY
jgi:hypothetical protein